MKFIEKFFLWSIKRINKTPLKILILGQIFLILSMFFYFSELKQISGILGFLGILTSPFIFPTLYDLYRNLKNYQNYLDSLEISI